MATIKDVAKHAGVSVTTVSRVINNSAPVNQETKQRVLKAIEELNFSPSIIAQGLRTKRSKTIGFLMPDYLNPFYHELLKYLEDEARKEGYHILLSSTGDDYSYEINYINDLINRNIDGIIICSYSGSENTIDYLLNLSKKMPVVFLDNINVRSSVNAVFTDGYKGIKEVTQHLIKLGHRKIAFIKGLSKYKVANDRFLGFMDALKENEIPILNDYIFEGDYNIKSGYEAAQYFLSLNNIPTAIVSSTDLMAIGAINYIKSKGLEIPQDIAIAGFDDIYLSKIVSPPLTTYKQPIKQIAKQTISLFIHKLNHPRSKNKQIKLEGQLLIRYSTDINASKIELIE
ncbi:LacI family DNA-binding transcriptional regulator [Caldicellulosiruptoraceae bacterium PP1]